MSYVIPQDHKCPKCGHETKFGPHEHWDKSPVTESGNPVCPKCWNEFLAAFGATMLCTVPWTKEGSEFEQAAKAKIPDFRSTPWMDYRYNR